MNYVSSLILIFIVLCIILLYKFLKQRREMKEFWEERELEADLLSLIKEQRKKDEMKKKKKKK